MKIRICCTREGRGLGGGEYNIQMRDENCLWRLFGVGGVVFRFFGAILRAV